MHRPALPLLHLVLALAVLAPLAGFAQASEEEASAPPLIPATEAPATEIPTPPAPQGEVFPREQPEEDFNAIFQMPRLLLQPPTGFLLGGGVGLVSVFVLFRIFDPICGGGIVEGASGTCPNLFYASALTTTALGTTVGVTLVGKLMHGRGGFWPTALGALLGIGAATLSVAATEPPEPVWIATLLAGSALGATVGFAVSDAFAAEPSDPAPRAGTRVSITPMVSATRTGGLVGGLVGRF